MSDDTPTMKRVEDMYSWAVAWNASPDPDDRADLVALAERQRAEFRRWLAEHDRQVAAEVLEGWGDYFEHWGSTVGSTFNLEGPTVARLLRGPKPFGTKSGEAPHE